MTVYIIINVSIISISGYQGGNTLFFEFATILALLLTLYRKQKQRFVPRCFELGGYGTVIKNRYRNKNLGEGGVPNSEARAGIRIQEVTLSPKSWISNVEKCGYTTVQVSRFNIHVDFAEMELVLKNMFVCLFLCTAEPTFVYYQQEQCGVLLIPCPRELKLTA